MHEHNEVSMESISENGEQSQSDGKRKRRSPSAVFFGWLAGHLQKTEKGTKLVSHVRERLGFYIQVWSLVQVVVVVLLIRIFVLTAFYIPSPSMLDTLKIKDRVFVFRQAYAFSEPKVGDIVVFRVPEDIPKYDPDKPIWIKRVVGVPGDTVSIEDNHLCINGERVTDPPFFKRNAYYQPYGVPGNAFPKTKVPSGCVLVFGDNSSNSYDSRYWGPIPQRRILGKAFLRFWPLSRIGPIHGESVSPLPPGS